MGNKHFSLTWAYGQPHPTLKATGMGKAGPLSAQHTGQATPSLGKGLSPTSMENLSNTALVLTHWHSERVAQEAKNNADTEAGENWQPAVSNSLRVWPLCRCLLLGQAGL